MFEVDTIKSIGGVGSNATSVNDEKCFMKTRCSDTWGFLTLKLECSSVSFLLFLILLSLRQTYLWVRAFIRLPVCFPLQSPELLQRQKWSWGFFSFFFWRRGGNLSAAPAVISIPRCLCCILPCGFIGLEKLWNANISHWLRWSPSQRPRNSILAIGAKAHHNVSAW